MLQKVLIESLNFQVGDEMVKYLEDKAVNNAEFEAKELFTNYAVAAIATTGFGIESKSFTDPRDPFKDQASTASVLVKTDFGTSFCIKKIHTST